MRVLFGVIGWFVVKWKVAAKLSLFLYLREVQVEGLIPSDEIIRFTKSVTASVSYSL